MGCLDIQGLRLQYFGAWGFGLGGVFGLRFRIWDVVGILHLRVVVAVSVGFCDARGFSSHGAWKTYY